MQEDMEKCMHILDWLGNSKDSMIACLANKDKMQAIFTSINLTTGLYPLLISYFNAKLELEKHFEDVRKMNAESRNTHDDGNSNDFDVMEMQHISERTIKRKCKQARDAIQEWWVPKKKPTENELEKHWDSECESDCEDCKERDKLRLQRRLQAKKNPYPKLFIQLLNKSEIGSCFSMHCSQYYIDHGYIRDGINVKKDTMLVKFVKKKTMHGMTWNQTMTECCIYYTHINNQEEEDEEEKNSFFTENIQLCPYEFHWRKNWDAVDTSQQDSVRILYQDVIFEDWVHVLKGFIIPNKEIQKYLPESVHG